jgi:hypothetical protein
MFKLSQSIYTPVLRLKQGEYLSLTEIQPDVRERLLPHFVIPPLGEPDPEKGRSLSIGELVPDSGFRVGRYWPLRPCLLDPRFLFSVLGEVESQEWVPRLFETALQHDARPIPVASLSDLEGPRCAGISTVVGNYKTGIAIRLLLDDLGTPELRTRLLGALRRLRTEPQQSILIFDFSDADLDDVQAVGDLLVATYHDATEIALWHRVIVEATSFPETNPAEEQGTAVISRNDWKAWLHAVKTEEAIRRGLGFGDYGADSAKFRFGSGRIKAIPHHRYSTPDCWFTARGSRDAPASESMRWVSTQIIASSHYAGPTFSIADAAIFERASGRTGAGTATIWRKINTVHHLTRVVSDLAAFYGYTIRATAEPASLSQASLF